MNIKKWETKELNKERAARIAEEYDLPFFVAMLLDIRGLHTDEDISTFLSDDAHLDDPFLLEDMDKAVERIHRAVASFEKIAIFGDYDTDGVTSTSMLYSYLQTIGADVMYYIPQREGEGYGMNDAAVNSLHAEGVNLIITVDNGIASVDEVAKAKSLGMDVVITDHHRPHESLPDAVAVVDPYREDSKAEFKDLSGAGVALKLLIALEGGDEDMILSEYADLAALGTIADVMPVQGENRTIIKTGLEQIITNARPGVEALLKKSTTTDRAPTARSLAFTVIPRINATGRMGASERAVKLLTCEFPEEAEELANEINDDNNDRRSIEAEITAIVMEQVESGEYKYDRVIVVSGDSWHNGVIGIVASRITEHFGKPCMIISKQGDMAKGSGRSVEGFSLFEAIASCGDMFEKFGGHPMAAGVTLRYDRIDEFRERINAYAKEHYEIMPTQAIKLDCKLNPQALSPQLPLDMQMLEPFGNSNPQPLFGLFNMKVDNVKPVGNGAHLRVICSKAGHHTTCMMFGTGLDGFPYEQGDLIDMAVLLDAKEYKGQMQLTVVVKNIKLSGIDVDATIAAYQLYEHIKRGESLTQPQAEHITPTREDIAGVYRIVKASEGKLMSLQKIIVKLSESGMNIGKVLVSLEVLAERGLISYEIDNDCIRAKALETNGTKTDIYASAVFERIKQLTA